MVGKSTPVLVRCGMTYQYWAKRTDAKWFYYEGMCACDGSEGERYGDIYCQLEDGATYATDDDVWVKYMAGVAPSDGRRYFMKVTTPDGKDVFLPMTGFVMKIRMTNGEDVFLAMTRFDCKAERYDSVAEFKTLNDCKEFLRTYKGVA